MRPLVDRLRADRGLVLAVLAVLLAVGLYAPTIGRGLTNYDDPWLVEDNWILQHPTAANLHTVWFDLDSPQRFVLTPEYLPVRDMSVMLDFAVWGTWWPGFHLTNVLLYAAAIAIWFAALRRFGVASEVAGLCVLLWAVHPSHAESVAWVAERKGLLAVVFAGLCALAYARWRAGGRAAWLVAAAGCAVCAVWSKAPGAFAVASIAVLELMLPERRASWRRSLVGLGVVGAAAAAAFVPVVLLALHASVVGVGAHPVAGRAAMVLGVHGFYLREVALTIATSVSYPLSQHGPTIVDEIVGAIGLAAFVAIAAWPRLPAAARAGAGVWLVGWLPIGHLILPLQMVLVADRYLLFPTLGLMLLAAVALVRIERAALRRGLIAVIVVAAGLRTLDAQASWRDSRSLWARAVETNPADGSAWAMYVDSLVKDAKDPALADAILEQGLAHTRAPRLVHRKALLTLPRDRAAGEALMKEAADAGEPIAMSNYALLLVEDGKAAEGLRYARDAARARPNAHAERTLGKVALAAGKPDEALAAFEHAYAVEPASCANRINLALALTTLGRPRDAIPHLQACTTDPDLGARARAELARIGP